MKRISLVLVIVMIAAMLLTGCGEAGKYDDASALFDEGKYEEALAIFTELGDYEDSADRANACNFEIAKALYDSGSYEEALEAFTALGDYEGCADYVANCEHQIMLTTYADVYNALSGNSWYFNGGDDLILNGISFDGETATIAQVSFDGNGKHDSGSNDYSFAVDDKNLILTLADGSTMEIPYTLKGDKITIGDGEYFSTADIEKGIQGYWTYRSSFMGLTSEKNILFKKGKVTSEWASEAMGGSNGEYYYYGPDSGSYEINFGGFDTDMRHGSEWFFNIIDGKVTVIHYDNVCKPSDGFPGANGYKF